MRNSISEKHYKGTEIIMWLYNFIKFLSEKKCINEGKIGVHFNSFHTMSGFFIRMVLFGKLYRLFTKPLHSDSISKHYMHSMIKTDSSMVVLFHQYDFYESNQIQE